MRWRRPPSNEKDKVLSKQQGNVTWRCERRSCHVAILRSDEDPWVLRSYGDPEWEKLGM